jgi:hypothetical protein
LKWGQKLCPNLLIKNKRIVQLINGKLDKNRYKNTTNEQHQKHQEAPRHKEDQLNELANPNGVHQSIGRGSFYETTLFFLLLLRDFSTFLIISSEAFPAKTQAISMPYPGKLIAYYYQEVMSAVLKVNLEGTQK